MKTIRSTPILVLVLFAVFSLAFQSAHAQSDEPLVIVLTADGPIMPPMLEYFKRGIEVAERENAEALIIQLKTPGGSLDTMFKIIDEIRASNVPVVVYVSPKGAFAGSAAVDDAKITAIQGLNAYFNVHSAVSPGGEIRGQLQNP